LITNDEVALVATAAQGIPPAQGNYIEEDYILNLMETVLDYQMNTKVVVRALEHYREHRWDDLRTREDLRELFARYPEDNEGNLALAQYLWGYNHWTRAQQLRDLTLFFRKVGVVDQESLRAWAARSTFKGDFEGKVKGLGIAVYHWLVMRQGVDTVKPDVHVRRFAERAVGRPLSDIEVVDVVTRAAHRLGSKAYELDWAIWEASRGGALPYPGSAD
jgi:hypothetical protein